MKVGVKIIQIQYSNIVLAFEHIIFFSNWDERLKFELLLFKYVFTVSKKVLMDEYMS